MREVIGLATLTHRAPKPLYAFSLLLASATFVLMMGILPNIASLAYAASPNTPDKLLAAHTGGTTDYYAVLHADGELVFQQEPPTAAESARGGGSGGDSEIAAISEGDLGGYGSANAVPWHADASQVRSVRFADDFQRLQPKSFKCWFDGCSNLTTIDLTNLDASQSTTMQKMFRGCSSLEHIIGLEEFDTSSSTYFGSMFSGCSSLKELDVSHFDATHVTVLCFMFNGCSSLESLNMSGSGWKTSSLGLMVHVWEGCTSLKSLDLSQLDTSNVRSMTYDFNGCASLEYLDLSGADTSNVSNLMHLLDGCTSLTTIKVGAGFSFNGASEERQFSFPDGNWKSASTNEVFEAQAVPNFTANTYTKVSATADDPEEQGTGSGGSGGSGGEGGSDEDGSEGGSTQELPSNSPSESGDSAVAKGSAVVQSAAAESAAVTGSTSAKSTVKGIAVGKTAVVKGNTYKVTSNKKATVAFRKSAKHKTKVVIPASVVINGKRYAVTGITRGAFKKTAAKTVIVKTKKLKKKSVAHCFKGASRLKTAKVPKSKKRQYKIIFAKANSGKAVQVR